MSVELLVEPDAGAVARRAADEVEQLVRARPDAVLGWAAGRTPAKLYAELARRRREQGLSFARTTAFILDEYVGVGPDDPRSFTLALCAQVFEPLDIAPERVHVPSGIAEDRVAECARLEAALTAAGGIDLQILGIGTNGHVAFNEPGSRADGRTRVVELTDETRRANGLDRTGDPTLAITMGLGTIAAAHRLLLLATGAGKAEIVRAALQGPETEQVPASLLRGHRALTVLVDEAAAARLARRET